MEPIKPRKLSAEVVDRLIRAISSQEFPPGSQLPSERELMALFGVGRPAVREALQKLEQMGLVRITHGERARVVNPSADDIIDGVSGAVVLLLSSNARGLEDLKEARLLAETGLVRIATQKAGAAELRLLERLHLDLVASRGDAERFIAADMAFHQAIADISGNRLIAATVRGILSWMTRFKKDLVSVRGADKITIAEHAKILKGVAAGDAEAAAAAMSEHLSRASVLYTPFLAPTPRS